MTRSLVAALLVACSLGLASRRALATPNFPGAVQRDLGAPAAPPCSLCHLCGITGRGTVNTPFGIALRARGLVELDESSLAAAVAAMDRDRVDSDGDGLPDVTAVRAGKDPNPGGLCDAQDDTIPRYGCVGRMAGPPLGRSRAAWLFLGALFFVRRRPRAAAKLVPWLALSAFVLPSCASGAALTPRPDPSRYEAPPAMQPVVASRFGPELRRLGLDPLHLPRFEALSGETRRRLMSTFTRSLGVACTDCHAPDDERAPTRAKAITVQMWNDFTLPYGVDKGPLFCDSCHRGQARYLDRRDKKLVSAYMTENFTDKLAAHDAKEVECATCHGESFEPHLLAK